MQMHVSTFVTLHDSWGCISQHVGYVSYNNDNQNMDLLLRLTIVNSHRGVQDVANIDQITV